MSKRSDEILEGLRETCQQAEKALPASLSKWERRIDINAPQTITQTAIRQLVQEAHRFVAMYEGGNLTDGQLVEKIGAIRTQIASAAS